LIEEKKMKKKTIKSRGDVAVEKFNDGYNCAQAVFYAFCDDLKIEKETALKLGTCFGAGMGEKGEVCGAVSGGLLVIGAKHGRGEKKGRSATQRSYKKTEELMDRFAAKRGSFICRELLDGCDLTTKKGRSYFKKNDFFNKTCCSCVQCVVEILEDML